MNILTREIINEYKMFLINEERAVATVEKYIRDIEAFYDFLDESKVITKEIVLLYKQSLELNYKPTSINSMLVAINGVFEYMGCSDCRVKFYRLQKKVFVDKGTVLTKGEYERLLKVASKKKNKRIFFLIQTICATGIRVSEHKYITVEALDAGGATINNKGKIREILIPKVLKKQLLSYCKNNKIKSGPVFVTRHGNPMNRSNIWTIMKKLCDEAGIDNEKVYPHNLRHLFAFTFYQMEKNLAYLADILGHSSIETTRIYTRTDSQKCRAVLDQMNLIKSIY